MLSIRSIANTQKDRWKCKFGGMADKTWAIFYSVPWDHDSSLSHIQTQFLVENNDGTITNRTSHLTSSINLLVNSSVSFSSWKVFLIGSTETNYIKIAILKRHMQCVSIFLYQIFNEFVLIFSFFPFFAVNLVLISLIHVLHLLMQSL